MASEMWYMMQQNAIAEMSSRLSDMRHVILKDVGRNPDTNKVDPSNFGVLSDIQKNLKVLSDTIHNLNIAIERSK